MNWTTERWARIEELFHAAAAVDGAQRAAFLVAQCGTDRELLAAVQQLVAADAADADAWLEHGVVGAMCGAGSLLGTRIGAFELVERIADGGMGTVYRARRVDADFDQQVAIKVLRLGLSTPLMRERFARERQTLARLLHPNVARLIDGGTTEAGVPFFAMEFVDGDPLDRFCDDRQLPLRERLRLFAVVCHAVQFAHQNLVVHLDLKPTNILVDSQGAPKLLDFGVAGLLSDIVAGSATVAATRSRPLTPEYASPEQLRGEPIATTADVYALGVVLYELLTGRRPHGRTGSDLELARAVCDTEPPRPSAAFAEAGPEPASESSPPAMERARRRASRPRDVERALRGDLDRIVAMALAKEPARRYASCQDLAEDVERFLHGFPVLARDPGMTYRMAKFVRRNALLVAAALAVVASLVGGIAASWHLANVARAERDVAAAATAVAEKQRDLAAAARAEAELERDAAAAARRRSEHAAEHARIEAASSHLVAEFLGETFLSSPLLVEPAERARVLAMIERRAEQVRRRHGDDDHLRANLLHALGRACTAIDAFAEAGTLLREAAAIRRHSFGEHSLEYALSLGSLGQLDYRQGRFADAVAALREAYRLHGECAVDVHTDVAQAANDLAAAERALGNVARARELHQQALALRRQTGDPVLIAESLNNLAAGEPDLQAARAQLEEAWQLRRELLGGDDPLTIQSQTNLGTFCLRVGRLSEAREYLRGAAAAGRALGGLGGDGLAVCMRSLAYAELRLQDVEAANTAIEAALALDVARLGREHPRVAACIEVRAAIEERQGRWPQACVSWREVVRIRETALPAGHRQTALAQCSLGSAMVRVGEATAAVDRLRTALGSLQQLGPAAAVDVADARVALALACEGTGDVAAAERELLAAFTDEVAAADASRHAAVRQHVHAFYVRIGRPEQASAYAATMVPAPKR